MDVVNLNDHVDVNTLTAGTVFKYKTRVFMVVSVKCNRHYVELISGLDMSINDMVERVEGAFVENYARLCAKS